MSSSDYKWMRTAGAVSSIGLLILISTLIGWWLGTWLDGKFKTQPWLTLVFLLLGLGAGFYESYKIIVKAIREEDDN